MLLFFWKTAPTLENEWEAANEQERRSMCFSVQVLVRTCASLVLRVRVTPTNDTRNLPRSVSTSWNERSKQPAPMAKRGHKHNIIKPAMAKPTRNSQACVSACATFVAKLALPSSLVQTVSDKFTHNHNHQAESTPRFSLTPARPDKMLCTNGLTHTNKTKLCQENPPNGV